jgi:hypothetical protein
VVVASYAAFFAWVVASIGHLDRKIDQKIDALDAKISPKLDALTISVSRLEGAVYHASVPERRIAGGES